PAVRKARRAGRSRRGRVHRGLPLASPRGDDRASDGCGQEGPEGNATETLEAAALRTVNLDWPLRLADRLGPVGGTLAQRAWAQRPAPRSITFVLDEAPQQAQPN